MLTHEQIQTIDWDRMPKGAVTFSLDSHTGAVSWYNQNEDFWDHGTQSWKPDSNPNFFTRYKIADFLPVHFLDKNPDFLQDNLPPNGTPCIWVEGGEEGYISAVGERSLLFRTQYEELQISKIHWKFRPIKSERDEWVKEVGALLGINHTPASSEWVGMVYDAMISGKLPIPKVNHE